MRNWKAAGWIILVCFGGSYALGKVIIKLDPQQQIPTFADGDLWIHAPGGQTQSFTYQKGKWAPCQVHQDGDQVVSYPDGQKTVYYHDQPYSVAPITDWDWVGGVLRSGKIGARARAWR